MCEREIGWEAGTGVYVRAMEKEGDGVWEGDRGLHVSEREREREGRARACAKGRESEGV